MKYLDLRSDTVTKPTDEMREAARNAEVGDDVWGDDPTVIELERYAAELLGKEAALFVTSGTQGNLVSILSQTSPGDQVLLDSEAHIYYYEVGGLSALGGTIPKLIRSDSGRITEEMVREAVFPENIHFPNPKLLCLENTHNRYGGVALSPLEIQTPSETAHELGLRVHLDGARLFNAAIYHNVDVKEFTRHVDTVQVCLSKGLSAPVGSIVAADEETIKIARKKRKMLGGGMRQAGIIAAPGLVALRTMRERLREDHENARKLGEGLKSLGFRIIEPQTNILVAYIDGIFSSVDEAMKLFESIKVGIAPFGSNMIRLTTNRHISSEDVADIIERLGNHLE